MRPGCSSPLRCAIEQTAEPSPFPLTSRRYCVWFPGGQSEIGLQVNSSRSAAVRDTCKSVTRILVVTGRYFSDVANALMPAVAGTAKGSSAAIRKPGADLFARMSELTRYDLQLLKNIYLKDKAHGENAHANDAIMASVLALTDLHPSAVRTLVML